MKALKALIVDDEKHVRDAIRLLAAWERHGITEVLEASDGEAAAALIAEHDPQIVMTDMRMPRKDGMELLTWISVHAPTVKTLVISGHDDFELIRHTIRTGGMDYILKPVEPDTLNEALSRAAEAWRADEEKRRSHIRQTIEVNQMKPHYRDRLLTDLLAGQGGMERLGQLARQAELPGGIASCRVGVISMKQFDRELLDKFHYHRQLLSFTLLNVSNELLKRKGVAFQNLDNDGEIVLLYWDGASPFRTALEAINEGLALTLQRRCHIGIGPFLPYPEGIARSYSEASAALWRRNLLQGGAHLHDGSAEAAALTGGPGAGSGAGPGRFPLLASRADKLRLAALSGSREQLEAAAEEWMADVNGLPAVTPEQLSRWNAEWDWLQLQWESSKEGRLTEAREREEELPEELSRPLPLDADGLLSWELWRKEMAGRLEAASHLLTSFHSKENHIIHDVAEYVKANYREEISLQAIASHFFLSREYISRKFKQEFGVTLSDFISRIRIDKAKVLLMNSQLRISQVAEMVGYQDENYFSKVFKKQEGIRPGEFRKQQ